MLWERKKSSREIWEFIWDMIILHKRYIGTSTTNPDSTDIITTSFKLPQTPKKCNALSLLCEFTYITCHRTYNTSSDFSTAGCFLA